MVARGWTKELIILGADGTNTIVGYKNGVIAYLEKLLGHPVHWEICLLHGNELPLRALFCHYDGKTSGPNSFKGPLGKSLEGDLTQARFIRFAKIKNDDFPQLSEEVACDLSSDQDYLYDICWGIIEGNLDEDFTLRQPGALNHARWLTLANRILLLYITTKSPSKELKRLAHIIILFYAPSWFWIKSHPRSVDGPKNLFKMVEFGRKLTAPEQKIANRVIQRNGFYAHPESILRTMLADSDKSLREKGVEKIIELRDQSAQQRHQDERGGIEEEEEEEEEVEDDEEEWEDQEDQFSTSFRLETSEQQAIESASIREFKVPDINFKAKSYPDLIDWKKVTFSEPPMTMSLSREEVLAFVDKPLIIPGFNCHTQAVERAIKLVTEAAGLVIGEEARDGFIRQKVRSRKEIGRCHTKKEFFPKLEKE